MKAAEALKSFARKFRRRTHKWMIDALGITKRRFYRFLAISKWSKATKNLVSKSPRPLSQTALFKLADKSWKNRKELFNALKKLIEYLAHRKRKMLCLLKKKAKKTTDRISKHLKSIKLEEVTPPIFKFIVRNRYTGEIDIRKTSSPDTTRKSLEQDPHLIIEGVYKVSSLV